MSLPGLPPQALAASMAIISPMDSFLQVFNTNPYFIGIMMLVLNLGGRFISLEVTKKQEQFLQHPLVRRLLIFTVFFVATRNIWVAFWLTITVVLFLGYLFNENSALCVFGSGGTPGSKCAQNAPTKPSDDLTPEEKEILQRLSAKAQRYQQQQAPTTTKDDIVRDDNDEEVEITDIYSANLVLLKSN